VAANARLALIGGGAYLRDRLAAQPSAPADLAKAVSSYLANADNSVQEPLRKDLDPEITQLNKLCA
jgi:hypothetical protein